MIEYLAISLLLQAGSSSLDGAAEEAVVLTPITVTAWRIANQQPASTFTATATALRFDPQINLQARGLPEGQSDITVRGGLFENTGFRLGAVTVTDPQTGHYAVEIPLDPAMLSSPEVLKIIEKDKLEGMRLGVSGTPTFFVNGKIYEGVHNMAEIEDRIAEELDIIEGRIP